MVYCSVIDDVNECEGLWKLFSPNEFLFDNWDYRICFYDPEFVTLHFIAAKEGEKTIGILPLWKWNNEGNYEFFGGEVTERNRFLVSDKTAIPALLNEMPKDTVLDYIDSSESNSYNLTQQETRYFLRFSDYENDLEKYFNSFGKKHRKNFRRDLKHPALSGYKVKHNDLNDFQRLVELNQARFTDGSFFAERVFVEGFERMMKKALERNELHMLSIEINGKVEAVELAILYNGVYNVLLGGNNLAIPNIGKLITVEHMKQALASGAEIIDFLTTECGWKKLWNLSEEPSYTCKIPDSEEVLVQTIICKT